MSTPISIYRDGIFATRGVLDHGRIDNACADLGDDVYDSIADAAVESEYLDGEVELAGVAWSWHLSPIPAP